MQTVYLLSPANCAGTRARLLLKSQTSPLTARLANGGAPLGEVFTFMSSLYFRGKLAYATRFGLAYVIAPGRGLLPVDMLIRIDDLKGMATVEVDEDLPAFREPLVRDATTIARNLGAEDRVVLLGSVATAKYVGPLLQVFGERLHFPATQVACFPCADLLQQDGERSLVLQQRGADLASQRQMPQHEIHRCFHHRVEQ